MKSVAILGAGPVGLILAACLSRQGMAVTVLARRPVADAVTAHGIQINETTGLSWRAQPDLVTDDIAAVAAHRADVVIVTCKTYDTENLAAQWVDAGGGTERVISAQNTVANEPLLAERFTQVAAASVLLGGSMPEPGVVQEVGPGRQLDLGAYQDADTGWIREFAGLLERAGIRSRVLDDPMAEKLKKLVRNCDGGLCAITGVAMNHLVGDDAVLVRKMMRAESLAVALADGVSIDADTLPPLLAREIPDAPGVYSSMWHDLDRAKGSSEIGWINGHIARRAGALGLAAPTNALVTQFATEMTDARQRPGAHPLAEFVQILTDSAKRN